MSSAARAGSSLLSPGRLETSGSSFDEWGSPVSAPSRRSVQGRPSPPGRTLRTRGSARTRPATLRHPASLRAARGTWPPSVWEAVAKFANLLLRRIAVRGRSNGGTSHEPAQANIPTATKNSFQNEHASDPSCRRSCDEGGRARVVGEGRHLPEADARSRRLGRAPCRDAP
jgi:hypothetical protein